MTLHLTARGPRPHRCLVVAAAGCALTVTLAACSSSDSGSGGAPAEGAAPSGRANGAGFGPRSAAAGEIAAASGTTLQVQGTDTQSAVTWSSTTSFTVQKAATLADVTVGSCVSAGSASGSTSSTTGDAVTATTVRISTPTDGSCTVGGFGGTGRPGGTAGGAMPSGMPSGMPTGARPSGAPGAGGVRPGGASGTVTAVSGRTITVAVAAAPGATSTSTSTSSATITVTSATTYTKTVKTTHKDAVVGRCAVVQGSTDSSGAVTATSIALSTKTNGSCTSGLAGQGGGRTGSGND